MHTLRKIPLVTAGLIVLKQIIFIKVSISLSVRADISRIIFSFIIIKKYKLILHT